MSRTLTRTPGPDQLSLWDLDSGPRSVEDPDGMEQPSMFAPVLDPPPFEACDECGLDIHELHHEGCGDCYCDGDPCNAE